MIVSEARTRAKELLAEKGGYWTDAEILRHMNLAMRDIWRIIAGTDPRQLAEFSRIVYPANSESIDLTAASYLNASFYKIMGINSLVTNAAISSTNPPTPMELGTMTDLFQRYSGGSGGQRLFTDARAYCAVQGNLLYIAPVPTLAKNLWVQWLRFPSPLINDTDNVIQGAAAGAALAVAFHDFVPLRTAWYMSAKELRGSVSPEIATCLEDLRQSLADGEQSRAGQDRIVYVDPY